MHLEYVYPSLTLPQAGYFTKFAAFLGVWIYWTIYNGKILLGDSKNRTQTYRSLANCAYKKTKIKALLSSEFFRELGKYNILPNEGNLEWSIKQNMAEKIQLFESSKFMLNKFRVGMFRHISIQSKGFTIFYTKTH